MSALGLQLSAAHGEIARQRPAAAAGDAILADSLAARVLLSASTAERVRHPGASSQPAGWSCGARYGGHWSSD
jgi:hypothetical protein